MRKATKRAYDFSRAKRGPVLSVPKGKTRITIRLDDDVLDWFRDQWTRLAAATTRLWSITLSGDTSAEPQEPLEASLRRVIREESSRAD